MAKQPMTIVQDQDGVFQRPEDMHAGNVPTEPRLRKVPGKVSDNGLLIIERAVMLHQSTRSVWSNEPEDVGVTITSICAEWMTSEQARLSAKGQP